MQHHACNEREKAHLDQEGCQPLRPQLFMYTEEVDLHHAFGIAPDADGGGHSCSTGHVSSCNRLTLQELLPYAGNTLAEGRHCCVPHCNAFSRY